MYNLVYVSTATKPLSEEELGRLLKTSRENNRQSNITGLLLYKEGNFMQFLEGAKETVLHLLKTIQADLRHHNLIVLLQQTKPAREFEAWSMGFEKVGEGQPPAGFSDLWRLPFTSEEFLLHPTACLELLLGFKRDL